MIEKCNHPYFHIVDGQLRCVKCNAVSTRYKIEDKEKKIESNKIYPPQSKRVGLRK